jgi:hypothetical protein
MLLYDLLLKSLPKDTLIAETLYFLVQFFILLTIRCFPEQTGFSGRVGHEEEPPNPWIGYVFRAELLDFFLGLFCCYSAHKGLMAQRFFVFEFVLVLSLAFYPWNFMLIRDGWRWLSNS